jgi:hypothetical protein
MANDSGTPAGERTSRIILNCGGALIAWVLLCSFTPSMVTRWLPTWPGLGFLLVRLPSYAFGLGGIAYVLLMGFWRYRLPSMVTAPEVKLGETAYPVTNPNPTQILELAGSLPETVPVRDVQVTYATDLTAGEQSAGPCQRLNKLGPKEFWQAVPILKTEVIPLTRARETYRASVTVDRYLPGGCNWHLRYIEYRLFVPKYGYRSTNTTVEVLDEKHRAAEAAKGSKLYQGRLDRWCGEALNKAVTPYYPVFCSTWGDVWQRIPLDQRNLVPAEATGSEQVVEALSGVNSVEVNFRDADAPAKSPASPISVAAARECQLQGFMAWRRAATPTQLTPEAEHAKLRELGHSCGETARLPAWLLDL